MAKNTNRAKADANKVITSDECQAAFGAYSDADAAEQLILAELDLAINKLRDSQTERLSELNKTKETQFLLMQAYATGNEKAFGVKKSIEFTYGKIGFRTGTPSLKTLKGFTWEAVTALLKKHRVLKAYLKVVTSPQKDKLLADRDLDKYDKYFKSVGIEVVKSESFFVELKKEEVLGVVA